VNILLIQDDPNIREKVVFVLDGQFNSTVFEADSAEGAKRILVEKAAENIKIHLMVIDCDKSKSKDMNRLRAEYSEIQSMTYLHGDPGERLAISSPPGHPIPVFVDRKDIIQNLITTVGALIKQESLPDPNDDRAYCKIRTKLLLAVCPLKSDIYIRLGESKYLRLMKQGDVFDLADMEKYTVKKGVEFLYLKAEQVSDFVRKFQDELVGYLSQKPAIQIEEVVKIADQVTETIQSLAASVGFTPEVQGLAKTQVQMTIKAMGKSPKLSKLLDKLESYRGQYIASHSTVAGYLACSIASQMQWGSETTFHKLTLAAFLHDITLTNHELAECGTIEESQKDKFSEAEQKAYKDHPMKGAEAVRQFSEVPPDVDIIIAQHHERPDGSGFPRTLTTTYIAPLAAIFIVAHEMAKFALAKGPSFKPADFLAEVRDKYKTGQFRKVVVAIEALI
jgi:HD-GYP domain-containing protein (c-di-GMP phosphodiesterase class II)